MTAAKNSRLVSRKRKRTMIIIEDGKCRKVARQTENDTLHQLFSDGVAIGVCILAGFLCRIILLDHLETAGYEGDRRSKQMPRDRSLSPTMPACICRKTKMLSGGSLWTNSQRRSLNNKH